MLLSASDALNDEICSADGVRVESKATNASSVGRCECQNMPIIRKCIGLLFWTTFCIKKLIVICIRARQYISSKFTLLFNFKMFEIKLKSHSNLYHLRKNNVVITHETKAGHLTRNIAVAPQFTNLEGMEG